LLVNRTIEITNGLTIKVNGAEHRIDVDGIPAAVGSTGLLGMTARSFGCGMALCGACTVHLNGAATRSCVTRVESIGDAAVTTIEAIVPPPLAEKSKKRGSISRWFNAATASQVRSCRHPRFSRQPRPNDADIDNAIPGTSAAAARTSAFVKQSNTQPGRPRDREGGLTMLSDRHDSSSHQRFKPPNLPQNGYRRQRRSPAWRWSALSVRRRLRGSAGYFYAQPFNRIGKRWVGDADHALCGDGAGHLQLPYRCSIAEELRWT